MLFHKLLFLALLALVYCSSSSSNSGSSESSDSSSSTSSSESSSSSGSESVSPGSSVEQLPVEDEAARFDLPYGMSAYEFSPRLKEYHQCINKCIEGKEKKSLNYWSHKECESGCYERIFNRNFETSS